MHEHPVHNVVCSDYPFDRPTVAETVVNTSLPGKMRQFRIKLKVAHPPPRGTRLWNIVKLLNDADD